MLAYSIKNSFHTIKGLDITKQPLSSIPDTSIVQELEPFRHSPLIAEWGRYGWRYTAPYGSIYSGVNRHHADNAAGDASAFLKGKIRSERGVSRPLVTFLIKKSVSRDCNLGSFRMLRARRIRYDQEQTIAEFSFVPL